MYQDVDAFENPKVDLEQYTTGIELGATMLHTVRMIFKCAVSMLNLRRLSCCKIYNKDASYSMTWSSLSF